MPNEFLKVAREALPHLDELLTEIRASLLQLSPSGRQLDRNALREHQHVLHGFAWIASYVSAYRSLVGWADDLERDDSLTSAEELVFRIGAGELLAQIRGGIAMGQSEYIRLEEFGLPDPAATVLDGEPFRAILKQGNIRAVRADLVEILRQNIGVTLRPAGNDAADHAALAEHVAGFVAERIKPQAHRWHINNELIPDEIIGELAALGVFGLTVPEQYGGMGLGKTAMCLVTEELSRGFLGIGSLGTRSEIAAELLLHGGTEEQKEKYISRLVSGDIFSTAAFTEPEAGSDLASVRCQAVRKNGRFVVNGSKIWITHAARSDLMTLLVRTNPEEKDYRGLSVLLVEKPRGSESDPFPAKGMSGSEIEVIGYRGMREYEIGFDEFETGSDSLLGGVEGQGFRQLMQTFESARIQTAARSVGVAQSAFDHALEYATQRRQFSRFLVNFPRVSDKIAIMLAETHIARLLTLAAARRKDLGVRCDLEAGMAKLYSAKVAWSAADAAVQVHGGNGFALENPVSRILCDARILSIFEGAAEIQAEIICRRLLETAPGQE